MISRNLLLIISILGFYFSGYALLRICGADKTLRVLEKTGLSYLFGVAAISIELFIFSVLKIQYNPVNIMLPWSALLIISLIFHKRAGRQKLYFKNGKINVFCKILITLIILQVTFVFYKACVKPVEAYDSVSIHALKSKIIYLEGSIPDNFLGILTNNFHGAHPDYPMLVSMAELWVYICLGNFDDFACKWLFPLSYLNFLFLFFSF